MPEHPRYQPLPEKDLLSEAKITWLKEPCGSTAFPGMTRLAMIFNTMSSTARPTDSSQTVFDQAFTGEKLHDKEPGAIVDRLESKIPGFFNGLPKRTDECTDKQKKQLICDIIRHFLHLGVRKYGKPGLRLNAFVDAEVASDVEEVG
jgi:hypothetical protein